MPERLIALFRLFQLCSTKSSSFLLREKTLSFSRMASVSWAYQRTQTRGYTGKKKVSFISCIRNDNASLTVNVHVANEGNMCCPHSGSVG